jgi:hypothetical protein
MDEVIQDFERQSIVKKQRIINSFRCFLISKPSGSARFIMDLSPWTAFYKTPPMRLYSAAEVISAIPPHYQLIKIDVVSGFFQIHIKEENTKYYDIYYQGIQYALHRLPSPSVV